MSVSSNTRHVSGATPGGGSQKSFGIRLAFLVVSGTNQYVEPIEQMESRQRRGHRFPGASRDDREGDAAVLGEDVLQDFGNGSQLRKEFEIEVFFPAGHGLHRH